VYFRIWQESTVALAFVFAFAVAFLSVIPAGNLLFASYRMKELIPRAA